jgi:hypothetical protein
VPTPPALTEDPALLIVIQVPYTRNPGLVEDFCGFLSLNVALAGINPAHLTRN